MNIIYIFLALFSSSIWAGQFSVSPIRIDLAPASRSDAITIQNTANEPLRVAIELKRWTQNPQGIDLYEASEDLVYFPRQLTIPAGEKRIVRIGRKAMANDHEMSYRLYVNEQPDPQLENQGGQLSMVVSFGVPVFVVPTSAKPALTISSARIDNDQLSLSLQNSGNSTVRLSRLFFDNEIAEITQFPAWYLQPGVTRKFSLSLPKEFCALSDSTKLTLESTAEPQYLQLEISGRACNK